MNAQHCLTIAAAFIAIIGVCATLISSANSKADILSTRIREATREYRERKSDERCDQIAEQIALFKQRIRRIQLAQRLLFSTIGFFIASLAIFMYVGLRVVYDNPTDEHVHLMVRTPVMAVGSCVAAGALLMLTAICLQFLEIGLSYKTLSIETSDCEQSEAENSSIQDNLRAA